MSKTLTTRIEAALDRWNALGRCYHHDLRGKVMEVSLQLAELIKLRRILDENITDLERRLSVAEAHDEVDAIGPVD